MSENSLKAKCLDMGASMLPLNSNFVTAIRPGNEAHATFQVDGNGNINMSSLHATVRLKGGQEKQLY